MKNTAPVKIEDTEFLKTMRRRFKAANDAETDQCERENDDIGFEDGKQWPADVELARKGQQPINGMPSVPARPTLVFDKVKEPVRQTLNQERAADIGIEITPADDFGDLGITPDDTEITLREGMVRRIQRDSHAQDARSWAFKRAVIAGRGFYMVMTRFLPGKTFDQEVYVHRIYDQSGVKLDPAHEMPDGSDADYEFVGTWMPYDRFIAEYPTDADGEKNILIGTSDEEFMGYCEQYPDWYRTTDGPDGEKAVRIVDYYYTDRQTRKVIITDDGRTFWAGPAPEGISEEEAAQYAPPDTKPVDERTVVVKQIKYCKVAGGMIELERTDWPSEDMPIVKVIGDEVLPYDGQKRYEGMVRPARGAQQAFNYMGSKFIEQVGLTPIPTMLVDPDSIDGYEEWWKVSNTRTLPYMPQRTRDDDGREFRQASRLPGDPNTLTVAQGLQIFDGLIKSTTHVPDSSLGNVDPSLKSGRAINAVVANAQLSTSNYLDNLARSMQYEAKIINGLLYPIYGVRPGRMVRVLTGEGQPEVMQIGGDPQQVQQQQALMKKAAKVAKLTKDAKFNIVVKITKNSESRRQQEATALGELISAEPQMMTWFGDLYLKNSDTPNRVQLAERAKVMLAPPIQQMLAAKEQGQEFNPQAMAQIQQLQQQLEQVNQAAQQMNQALQTKQAENQTKLQIEQLKAQLDAQKIQLEAQRDIELQKMKDATAIRVAEINAQTKGLELGHTLLHESDAMAREQSHEAALEAASAQHEMDMATIQHANSLQMQMAQPATPPEGEQAGL